MAATDAKTLLLQELDAARDSQVQLLQAFVRAASPNPPGQTAAAAGVLTAYLSSKGIPYEVADPQGDGRPNIVSDFAGGLGAGPRVVLNGHMDVFPAGDRTDWDRDPWSGDVDGDRLHGRGVVDMKSGTASLVVAYASLYGLRARLRGSVALCAVADEETGGRWGTALLLAHDRGRWGGDVMLSAEPGGCGSIRFAEKGTLRLAGTLRTAAAHGAYTHLSKGAIRTAARFLGDVVCEVEALPVVLPGDIARHIARPEVGHVIDDIMGPGAAAIIARPTVNVGTICGGLKVNMIPDSCVFELDVRLPPGLVRDQVLAAIRALLPQYADASVELVVQEAASNPASYSALDHPMIALLADNAKLIAPGADKPLAVPSMGATDCKHYRYAGIPAYVYGCSPRTMAQANESASIREFLHVTKVHACATLDFLQ